MTSDGFGIFLTCLPSTQPILWFRILVIFSVENIAKLGVFMFQTSGNSQLCIDSQYSSQ